MYMHCVLLGTNLYYYMLYGFVEAVAMSYNLLCKTVDINELVVKCG